MESKDRFFEMEAIMNDLIESLQNDDPWWKEGRLTAEKFFADWMDEDGIVYDCLDWNYLREDVKEDWVRGTIDELREPFEDALGLAEKAYGLMKRLESQDFPKDEEIPFHDWPVMDDFVITGFRYNDKGFIFLAHKMGHELEPDIEIVADTKKDCENLLAFVEEML